MADFSNKMFFVNLHVNTVSVTAAPQLLVPTDKNSTRARLHSPNLGFLPIPFYTGAGERLPWKPGQWYSRSRRRRCLTACKCPPRRRRRPSSPGANTKDVAVRHNREEAAEEYLKKKTWPTVKRLQKYKNTILQFILYSNWQCFLQRYGTGNKIEII